MSTRLTDALLHHGDGQGWDGSRFAPMLDPRRGGQMGVATNYAEIVSSQQHMRRNLNIVVLKAPEYFNHTEDPRHYVGVLKNLFELAPLSIDGFNQTIDLEHQETPFGRSGEVIETVSHSTRQRSNPVIRVGERYGKPFVEFMKFWVQWCLMDPDFGAPLVTTAGKGVDDTLMDNYAATILAYEPDPTNKYPVEAWLGFNITPKTTGEIIGRREITAGYEQIVYDIPFTMTQQVGAGVKRLAQQIMRYMDITNANPARRAAAMNGIAQNVDSLDVGLRNNIESLINAQM